MWFGLPDDIEMLILEYDSTYKELYNKKLFLLNNIIMLHKQISLTYDNVYVLDKRKFLDFHRDFYRFALLRIKKQTKIQP
jgi:hypothetical protein